uniref:Uncharacterized protein n=1 Tax=Crocodylus porosus TaxID=8502 RepID=A0A7M4FU63_CROPO
MTQKEKPLLIYDTDYPDVVVDVGKVTLGEKRKKMAGDHIRAQNSVLIPAACALLNSGGGVITLEIENEDYNYKNYGIGLDMETSFRNHVINSPDLTKYFNDIQQNSKFLILKSQSREKLSSAPALLKQHICSLNSGLCQKSLTSVASLKPDEAFEFLEERKADSRQRYEEKTGPTAKRAKR